MLIVKARTSKGNVPVDVKTFTFPGGELQVTAEIVALRTVFKDGEQLRIQSLRTIRNRLKGAA